VTIPRTLRALSHRWLAKRSLGCSREQWKTPTDVRMPRPTSEKAPDARDARRPNDGGGRAPGSFRHGPWIIHESHCRRVRLGTGRLQSTRIDMRGDGFTRPPWTLNADCRLPLAGRSGGQLIDRLVYSNGTNRLLRMKKRDESPQFGIFLSFESSRDGQSRI
jgi:hypothetical protein